MGMRKGWEGKEKQDKRRENREGVRENKKWIKDGINNEECIRRR